MAATAQAGGRWAKPYPDGMRWGKMALRCLSGKRANNMVVNESANAQAGQSRGRKPKAVKPRKPAAR